MEQPLRFTVAGVWRFPAWEMFTLTRMRSQGQRGGREGDTSDQARGPRGHRGATGWPSHPISCGHPLPFRGPVCESRWEQRLPTRLWEEAGPEKGVWPPTCGHRPRAAGGFSLGLSSSLRKGAWGAELHRGSASLPPETGRAGRQPRLGLGLVHEALQSARDHLFAKETRHPACHLLHPSAEGVRLGEDSGLLFSLRGSMPAPGAVHTPPGQGRLPPPHCTARWASHPLGLYAHPTSTERWDSWLLTPPLPHAFALSPLPGHLQTHQLVRPPSSRSYRCLAHVPKPSPTTLRTGAHLQRPGPVPVTTATAPATPLIRRGTRSGRPAALLLPRTAPRSLLVPVDSSPAKLAVSPQLVLLLSPSLSLLPGQVPASSQWLFQAGTPS